MTTPIKDTSDSDTHCSHCITYEGLLYSTLDRTSPDDVVLGTQSEFLELPNGWNVAKWSEGLVHNVIAKYPWGTHCLVLSSGSAYYTALAETTQANGSPGDKFNSSQGLLALSGMWEAKDFTDCEVVCHGGSVRCHRAVLAQASPVFKQMLCGEMVEAKTQRIPLESVDMEVVLALLNFAYTGKVTCDPVHFPALTKLSDQKGQRTVQGSVAIRARAKTSCHAGKIDLTRAHESSIHGGAKSLRTGAADTERDETQAEDEASRAPAAVPKSPPRRPQAAAPQAAVPQAAAPQVKWQRMESRTQAGVYYYWDPVSGQTMADPPPPWEKKQSRTRPDIVYWWNSQTNLTSAEKPVV
ncbi:unnamed protein product [Prorocentrum cordatum]|uniref:BTB domain-containing protein n=1 Tax=Prorocentrum cordatum TaxID=2364126 RepID=A0ABN9TEK3_9DINO|nr:unnamed protein product [Polarella glacialis]